MTITSVGRLAESPTAELLAHAFNQVFTGTLIFEMGDEPKSLVGFSQGAVNAAHLGNGDDETEHRALSEVLPADTLRFVSAHAERQGCALLTAAESLALLPPGAIHLVRRSGLVSRVLRMVSLPPDTLFGFFPATAEAHCTGGTESSPEPISLIFSCLMAEPSLDRVRAHIEPHRFQKLRLADAGIALSARFPAPLPTIIQRFRTGPRSFDELAALNLASVEQLTALIHTLRITHQLLGVNERVTAQPPTIASSRVPRRGSSQALRQTVSIRTAPASKTDETHLPETLRRALRPPRIPSNNSSPSSSSPSSSASAGGSPSSSASAGGSPSSSASAGGSPSSSASAERRPAPSVPPKRSASSGNFRATHTSSGRGGLPPRPSIEPPNKSEQELRRQWPERAAEAHALQKWADATGGDPSGIERASASVDRLAKLFPRNSRIRYYNGCLHGMAERVEAAMMEFRAVLDLDPNNVEAPLEMERIAKRTERQ